MKWSRYSTLFESKRNGWLLFNTVSRSLPPLINTSVSEARNIMADNRVTAYARFQFDNAAESCVISGIDIYPVLSCKDLIRHLKGEKSIRKADREQFPAFEPQNPDVLDFADVKG